MEVDFKVEVDLKVEVDVKVEVDLKDEVDIHFIGNMNLSISLYMNGG